MGWFIPGSWKVDIDYSTYSNLNKVIINIYVWVKYVKYYVYYFFKYVRTTRLLN